MLDARLMQRPALPRHFYEPTLHQGLQFFLFTCAMIVVPGAAAVTLWQSAWPVWIRLPLCLPLVLLTSQGYHLVGWFAHEGLHLSLARNKYLSIVAGVLVSGIALFPAMGYAITHWNHHRYTNQESDPDTRIYPAHRTFWSRFLLARITANRGYLRNTLALLLGRPLPKGYRLPFSDLEQRALAGLTLLNMAAWACAYTELILRQPVVGLLGVVLPLLCTLPITGLRIYLEHNGTGAGILRDTRSYVSPFYTFMLYGNNMHLEHHLYPKVPCYNLPKVHRYLRDLGCYERWGSPIAHGVLAPLRFLGSDYQYPGPRIGDLPADPFRGELESSQHA